MDSGESGDSGQLFTISFQVTPNPVFKVTLFFDVRQTTDS